jgi:hypothetical protein
MDDHHTKSTSAIRRKLRGPERSQCPAYRPFIIARDSAGSDTGLLGGIRRRPDIDYARTLVGTAHVDSDEKHWLSEGRCEIPPVHYYVCRSLYFGGGVLTLLILDLRLHFVTDWENGCGRCESSVNQDLAS